VEEVRGSLLTIETTGRRGPRPTYHTKKDGGTRTFFSFSSALAKSTPPKKTNTPQTHPIDKLGLLWRTENGARVFVEGGNWFSGHTRGPGE